MRNYNNKQRQNWNQRKFQKPDQRSRQDQPRASGLQVFLRDGEDINKALRKLKKKIERAGLLKELRDRQYYEKPSEKRRKAKKAGINRWKKRQKELELSR